MHKVCSRLLGILLLISLLASAGSLVACGNTASETTAESDTAAVETQTDTTPAETTRADYPDDLPEKDFGGQEYIICNTITGDVDKEYEILSAELTGEACNDAVYHRNVKIEDRFNTHISALMEAEPESVLKQSALSGDSAFTLCGYVNFKAYVPVAAGACLNWNDMIKPSLGTTSWLTSLPPSMVSCSPSTVTCPSPLCNIPMVCSSTML